MRRPVKTLATTVSSYVEDHAVVALTTTKPPSRAMRRGRRGRPRVTATIGIAATVEAMAQTETRRPTAAGEHRRSALICGSRPAGIISVSRVEKAAVDSGSRAASGSFVGALVIDPRSVLLCHPPPTTCHECSLTRNPFRRSMFWALHGPGRHRYRVLKPPERSSGPLPARPPRCL